MTYLDYLLVREMRLLKNVGWSFIVQFTAPVFEVFLQQRPDLASTWQAHHDPPDYCPLPMSPVSKEETRGEGPPLD